MDVMVGVVYWNVYNLQVYYPPLFSLVLPSDNSVVFGEKTLFIHPRRERNLDWLYELEETNRYYNNTSSEFDPDFCCCPFLKITSKSLKSKK